MSFIVRIAAFVFLLPLLGGVLGCSLHGALEFDEVTPTREAVLKASAEVIRERYPMSRVSRYDDYVAALTHTGLDANYRTRKQISVVLQRNFTGHFEPVVRVRHYADIATPELSANPAGIPGNVPGRWSPFADHEWKAIGFLPYEEQALTDAILGKLAGVGS